MGHFFSKRFRSPHLVNTPYSTLVNLYSISPSVRWNRVEQRRAAYHDLVVRWRAQRFTIFCVTQFYAHSSPPQFVHTQLYSTLLNSTQFYSTLLNFALLCSALRLNSTQLNLKTTQLRLTPLRPCSISSTPPLPSPIIFCHHFTFNSMGSSKFQTGLFFITDFLVLRDSLFENLSFLRQIATLIVPTLKR